MITFKEAPRCYSAANRIINRTNAHNEWRISELGKPRIKLTGKRLQKILYLCQLFWYIDHDESNMISEDFVAWPNGPIIPKIYDCWSVYQDGDMSPYRYVKYTLSEEEADLINRVVDNTVDIPTEAIIDYIQSSNGPWEQAFKNNQGVISKKSIKQYIRREEAQIELVEFIKNETTKYENSGLKKKLTPPKQTENK